MAKATNQKKELEDKLKKLIKKVDEEGLLFLIKQANIIIYNLEVDEINKKQSELDAKSSGDKKANQGKNKPDKIEIIPDKNKSSFIIVTGNARKFFSQEDFKSVVRICQTGVDIGEKSERLYRWMSKERSDFLIDNFIKDKTSPILKELIDLVKSKYKTNN